MAIPAYTLKMRKLAFIALPLFALSLTFGAYDWLLGLDYHWFSTMWGPFTFLPEPAGSSMSLLVLVITGLAQRRIFEGDRYDGALPHHGEVDALVHGFLGLHRVQPIHAHLVCEHAGRDRIFYPAKHGIVERLSLFLVIGRFFVPFALLLVRSPKKKARQLCMIAGWLVFMQLVDIYVVILPALHGSGLHLSIWDLVSLVGIGATLGFLYLRIARRGRRSFRIAIPACWSLFAQPINRDARRTISRFQPRSMFSTWIGVVLLFAFFGLLALVVIGHLAARRQLRRKAGQSAYWRSCKRCVRKRPRSLTTYAWVDKSKGVVRIPIEQAMKLTVAELAQKNPRRPIRLQRRRQTAPPQRRLIDCSISAGNANSCRDSKTDIG